MKKKALRGLALLLITVCFVCSNSSKVYAATESCLNSVDTITNVSVEANKLIAEVDEDKLLQDAVNDVVDEQVPLNLNQQTIATLEFTPFDSDEQISFDVHQTIQKVGDIVNNNGETATLYVAAAVATDDKSLDKGFNQEHGITAHVFVYWIDNLGTNNELYSISVWWDLGDVQVKNRSVTYGVMNFLGTSFTNSNTISISVNDYQKDVFGTYYGFVLGCRSSIEVINKGTVTCTVHSTFA